MLSRHMSFVSLVAVAVALVGCADPSGDVADAVEQNQTSATAFETLMGRDVSLFALMCTPADGSAPPFRLRGFFQGGLYPHVHMDSGAEPGSSFFDPQGVLLPSPEPAQLTPFDERDALLVIENAHGVERTSISFVLEKGELVAKG